MIVILDVVMNVATILGVLAFLVNTDSCVVAVIATDFTFVAIFAAVPVAVVRCCCSCCCCYQNKSCCVDTVILKPHYQHHNHSYARRRHNRCS